MKHINLRNVSTVLVGILALSAFILSAHATIGLVEDLELAKRPLSWLYALILDGGIAIFALSVLDGARHGEDVTNKKRLVIGATIIAIGFNIAHAPNLIIGVLLGWIPPLFLYFSFDVLLDYFKFQAQETAVKPLLDNPDIEGIVTPIIQAMLDRRMDVLALPITVPSTEQLIDDVKRSVLEIVLPQLEQTPVAAPKKTAVSGTKKDKEDRAQLLTELLKRNPNASQRELAQKLNCSPSTVNGILKNMANGQG